MKKYHAWILYIVLADLGVLSAPTAEQVSPVQRAAPVATETSKPRIVERWTDGRVWQRIVTNTLADGSTVVRSNRVVVLTTRS